MTLLYAPVLKLKKSEMKALCNLRFSDKEAILPIIQILPDTNPERKKDYLLTKIKELTEGFANSSMPLIADFEYYPNEDLLFIEQFLSRIQQKINFIPVISGRYSQPPYINFIKEKYLTNGICVKLEEIWITNATTNQLLIYLSTRVAACKKFFQVTESEIDILLDLEQISGSGFPELPNKIIEAISLLENGKNYRRIIISAGSFPKNLGDFVSNTERIIYRHEWELWHLLRENLFDFNIIYSDYGNLCPIFNPDQEKFLGSCSIKYTLAEDFFILKGNKPDKDQEGFEQYIKKSLILTNSENYDGEDFSWGDRMIANVANKKQSTGNASTWIQYTLNHHITKMISLLKG